MVELHAIHQGLPLAREINFEDIICYSNSLHYVNILKKSPPQYHKYATLI